ncbi:MAG: hypothetical protein ACRBCT_08195 [Alphaproteobacteria bacterium]
MIFNGKKGQDGFSIIEISIGLIITGLVMVAFLKAYRVHVERVKLESEKALMADITQYIDAFPNKIDPATGNAYGRLPCPAPLDASGYGNDYNNEDPSITPIAGTTGPVLIGKIPTGTLGVVNSYMKDLNKEYLLYAVTQSACDAATYASSTGAITVIEEGIDSDPSSGTFGDIIELDTHTNAQYIVLSFGDNQNGTYAFDGTQPAACPAAAIKEHENCNGDSIFRVSLRHDQDNNDNFDDLVQYSTNSAAVTASNVKTLRPARSGEDYEYVRSGRRNSYNQQQNSQFTILNDGYINKKNSTSVPGMSYDAAVAAAPDTIDNVFFKVEEGDIITRDTHTIKLNNNAQIPDERIVNPKEAFIFSQTPGSPLDGKEGYTTATHMGAYDDNLDYAISTTAIELYVEHQ